MKGRKRVCNSADAFVSVLLTGGWMNWNGSPPAHCTWSCTCGASSKECLGSVCSRPQHWFQQLINDRVLDHWWKENFRDSWSTFERICKLFGPALRRQRTTMRDALPVPKKVSASLWRLATGECYCSCGLMMGLSKPSVIRSSHEFVQEICRVQNFIKFRNTWAEM